MNDKSNQPQQNQQTSNYNHSQQESNSKKQKDFHQSADLKTDQSAEEADLEQQRKEALTERD
jgi:hypothetical protein